MNELLKEFILAHEADSPAELMLHRDRWPEIDMELAVRCIRGRQTARHKLPLWYAEPGLVYPQSLSLEQCSSQATALYKQRFVHSGDRVADLTGGLGADSWSLSQTAASVDYFERSEELCACARHNFSILGRDNITVHWAETTPEMLGGIPSDTSTSTRPAGAGTAAGSTPSGTASRTSPPSAPSCCASPPASC